MSNKIYKVALTLPTAGRDLRFELAKLGKAPKEFFYGSFPHIIKQNNIELINSRTQPRSLSRKLLLNCEYFYRRWQKFPININRALCTWDQLQNFDTVVSFTDFHTLSLGALNFQQKSAVRFIGGFHGLSDIYHKTESSNKKKIVQKVNECISGLDKVFFFGDADRNEALNIFSLKKENTQVFKFGVDTNFWINSNSQPPLNYIFSAGSDINRDYETLIKSTSGLPLKILTTINLKKYQSNSDLTIIGGNLHSPKITDIELKQLYQNAKFVVVPSKDVWQPSGNSVAFQAMACGKAVILSDFKGLWDKDYLKDGENCLLVKSGCEDAMRTAVLRLWDDKNLREKIAENARKLCKLQFSLERINAEFNRLIS